MEYYKKIPRARYEREILREKGAFWTPSWVAEAMVAYVLSNDTDHIFDPAVGSGVFFLATKKIAEETGRKIKLLGTEMYSDTLDLAIQQGLSKDDLVNVQITDFVLNPPKGLFKAIVANPPYIRHHRLPYNVKKELKSIGTEIIGTTLDGRAGLHVYFLIRALQLLKKNGKLAFIMPADTCEGVFAPTLWNWITTNYRLEVVVTFAPEASPFPEIDVNPIIFMIRNMPPTDQILWVKCKEAKTTAMKEWFLSGFKKSDKSLSIHKRSLSEALATGLSRPEKRIQKFGYTLSTFANVMRGIATGDNGFFFLTVKQAEILGIPKEFLIPAIGRTRDVPGDVIDSNLMKSLELKGRPTLIFSPDGRQLEQFPEPVRKYLKLGEAKGIHKKPLIATRNPWYKMEVRSPPPIIFAYLGRRHARFIRNYANVVPLTGFLCVYPHNKEKEFTDKLFEALNHPRTISNLSLVGKSYGQGAIKVEPRALEKLPIPESVVFSTGLDKYLGN